jgi:hypothetical protein
MRSWMIIGVVLLGCSATGLAEDLGSLSANPFDPDSTTNPFGKGSPFAPNGVNNPFSPYGGPFSNTSATNPFATDAPRLYDQQGNYRGKLSANPYDPDSTSNQFGRYGSVVAGFPQQPVWRRKPISIRFAEQSIRKGMANRREVRRQRKEIPCGAS